MASLDSPHRVTRTAPKLLAVLAISVVAGCASNTAAPAAPHRPLLDAVAEQIGLPAKAWTASGTHTAKGYTTEAAQTTSAQGMAADCDNINLNKKLAADFRSDVFGPGVKGFFYKCEKVAPDTNQYWFTISSADQTQIDKLCDPATTYPIVHDQQHDTYWIDEPFTCTSRTAGTGGVAAGAPAEEPVPNFTPPNGCGQDTDSDSLWQDVRGRKPGDKGPNIAILPEQGPLHFALHNGNRKGESDKYNLLVIPTTRVAGIECDKILDSGQVLNLWPYAWEAARNQFGLNQNEIMLGINSMDGRTHDQLHIHLTAFNARAQLDKLTNIPSDLTKWNDSMYALGEHAYRIVHVKTLDTNPFTLLQDYVAKPYRDRFAQSLAVVADDKHGGFYLIATQGKPRLSGQPEHKPELRVQAGTTTYWGTETVEGLMNRG